MNQDPALTEQDLITKLLSRTVNTSDEYTVLRELVWSASSTEGNDVLTASLDTLKSQYPDLHKEAVDTAVVLLDECYVHTIMELKGEENLDSRVDNSNQSAWLIAQAKIRLIGTLFPEALDRYTASTV